jgi:hypothetical protein
MDNDDDAEEEEVEEYIDLFSIGVARKRVKKSAIKMRRFCRARQQPWVGPLCTCRGEFGVVCMSVCGWLLGGRGVVQVSSLSHS